MDLSIFRINIDRFYVKYYYKDIAAYQNDFAVFIRACVKNQAFKVLGSVDFLGNPLGLAHDIKDGLQGVLDGNLTSVMRGKFYTGFGVGLIHKN